MALQDCRGVETSATDPAEVVAHDEAFETFLNYEAAAGANLKQVLADHPSSVMSSVLRGHMMLMLETTGVQGKVAAQAESLLANEGRSNARERLHIDALARWAGRDVFGAAAVWSRLLAENPLDLLALKMHHYTTFWTGRANVMLSTVEGVFDAWSETDPGYDHLLGMYAFALNECGRYEAAERIGRTAVELNPEDLWSVHSVAHALEMQGDLSAGVELFDVDPAIWATKNPFIGHIWWHSALFRWNAGDYDRVLDVYDERLQPASTDFYLDIQNMSSLLVRLEYVGVDVGDRWDEISEHAAARVGDHVLAFTDAHCVLTLARTGRLDDLDAFMSSLDESRSRGSGGSAPVAVTATDTVIELGRGLAAMGRGEHERAAEVIGAISGDLAPIGGSHAQRDLFDLVLEDCAERAGDLDMALQLLRARSRRWPNSVPTWTRYSNVLQSAGHVSLADDAHRRAMEVTRP